MDFGPSKMVYTGQLSLALDESYPGIFSSKTLICLQLREEVHTSWMALE